MILKPEVVRALQREQRLCKTAIERLEAQSAPWEEEYGWNTELFLQKFNAGEAGDEQDFFRWFAVAEAIKDWQRTYNSLGELLSGLETAHA